MKHTNEAYDLDVCVDHRLPASIDRFFVLVEDWLAAKEAVTSDGHARIGSGSVQCAGESRLQNGAA